jgi:hypothetical protein
MTTVDQLLPGDLVTKDFESAIYVAQTRHPLWLNLQLVIWRMEDGNWSHDALFAAQDVGEAAASTAEERTQRLRQALLAGRETH